MTISPVFVVSGKLSNEPERWREKLRVHNGDVCRFGRCWWFWMPRIKWNRALPWKDYCTDISLQWLCFQAGILIWSR